MKNITVAVPEEIYRAARTTPPSETAR